MKRLAETMTIEDGSQLRLYECVACTARVFAGVDKRLCVATRQLPALGA